MRGTEEAYGERPSEDTYSFFAVESTLRLSQWESISLNFPRSPLFAETVPAVRRYRVLRRPVPHGLAGKREAEGWGAAA